MPGTAPGHVRPKVCRALMRPTRRTTRPLDPAMTTIALEGRVFVLTACKRFVSAGTSGWVSGGDRFKDPAYYLMPAGGTRVNRPQDGTVSLRGPSSTTRVVLDAGIDTGQEIVAATSTWSGRAYSRLIVFELPGNTRRQAPVA